MLYYFSKIIQLGKKGRKSQNGQRAGLILYYFPKIIQLAKKAAKAKTTKEQA